MLRTWLPLIGGHLSLAYLAMSVRAPSDRHLQQGSQEDSDIRGSALHGAMSLEQLESGQPQQVDGAAMCSKTPLKRVAERDNQDQDTRVGKKRTGRTSGAMDTAQVDSRSCLAKAKEQPCQLSIRVQRPGVMCWSRDSRASPEAIVGQRRPPRGRLGHRWELEGHLRRGARRTS